MVLSAAKAAKVDVAIHLDHAQNLELVKKCIDAGFSSVMYDGSHFNLEKNIKESKEVIEYANKKVFVEIEIGKVGGKEDDLISKSSDTVKVSDAVAFYNKTKPDALAVAFGTSHGIYKEKANLNFSLIKDCAKIIPVPLVMHGTSGVPFPDITKAINSGVTKINVGTDLLISFNQAIRKYLLENPSQYDIRKINTLGIIAVTKRTKDYLEIFNKCQQL
jgi:fructose-bisphosphate aldolase class II